MLRRAGITPDSAGRGIIPWWIVGRYNRDGFAKSIKGKVQSGSKIPSPIVRDLDADGVETTSVTSGGTYFDHAADGFAERTGWVGSDDGLLVRDLNGNGQIDSGRELFGCETRLASGGKAANGFAALAELDTNANGRIDAGDAGFADLRVWKDANGDGVSQASELQTLAQAGVQSIATGYANSSYIDPQGNQHRQVGSYTTRTGQTRTATDIWVKTDPMLSIATDWLEVPDQIAELPDAVGYGLVRDLHQAMAVEAQAGGSTLKNLVSQFGATASDAERVAALGTFARS